MRLRDVNNEVKKFVSFKRRYKNIRVKESCTTPPWVIFLGILQLITLSSDILHIVDYFLLSVVQSTIFLVIQISQLCSSVIGRSVWRIPLHDCWLCLNFFFNICLSLFTHWGLRSNTFCLSLSPSLVVCSCLYLLSVFEWFFEWFDVEEWSKAWMEAVDVYLGSKSVCVCVLLIWIWLFVG